MSDDFDNVFDLYTPPTVRKSIEVQVMSFGDVQLQFSPEFGRNEYDLQEALDALLDAVETLRGVISDVREEEM
ncbi:MAG TPA: hypothetical protein VJQ82_26585, partial [Terriglobales bacterium]|nr:hypothetical protein [Terriglobales bacterium]